VKQIVAVLKRAEREVPVAELIRQLGSPSKPYIAGRSSTRGWRRTSSASWSNCKMRTRGWSGWWPSWRWTGRCWRMCCQKSCDALAVPPGGLLFEPDLPGERPACVPGGAAGGIDVPLSEPAGTKNRIAVEDSRESRRHECAMATARSGCCWTGKVG